MIEHAVIQNTPEWQMLRAGIPTASAFDNIITPKGLKPSAGRVKYMNRLLAEWITGCPLENPQTAFMQEGHSREDQTAAAYELATGYELRPCGFFTTNDGRAGASPDRCVVGINRGAEVKSPQLPQHVAYMRDLPIDEEYAIQLYGQIWVCEFDGVDIVSWCDLVPASAVVIKQVHRDDKNEKEIVYVEAIEAAVNQFCEELAEAKIQIVQKYGDIEYKRPMRTVDAFNDSLGITDADVEAILANAGVNRGQD